jgi:hypothetical protein
LESQSRRSHQLGDADRRSFSPLPSWERVWG